MVRWWWAMDWAAELGPVKLTAGTTQQIGNWDCRHRGRDGSAGNGKRFGTGRRGDGAGWAGRRVRKHSGGTLQLSGTLTAGASAPGLGAQAVIASPAALISSNLNLGTNTGAPRQINVGAVGYSSNVLEIDGAVSGGRIDKVTGTGTLTLTNTTNNLSAVNESFPLTATGSSGSFTLSYRGDSVVVSAPYNDGENPNCARQPGRSGQHDGGGFQPVRDFFQRRAGQP